MNLTSPREVRACLEELGRRPLRTLGQNFLIDRNILDILLGASGAHAGESILEVGPGLGVVTEALLARGCRVLAVEKDPRLAAFLRERQKGVPGFTLIEADAMELDHPELLGSHGVDRVVANLPYGIASALLFELTIPQSRPGTMVVTVQKEVADRVCAAPSTPDYGVLSVWLQLLYEADEVKVVSRNCFWPRPEVASAIVRLRRREESLLPAALEGRYRELTKEMFGQRRKQLGPRLAKSRWGDGRTSGEWSDWLEARGLSRTARPEELSVELWSELAATVS